ncbi:MAG: redoxin domain-containing protein [Pyrinomonadaceae bacterium]
MKKYFVSILMLAFSIALTASAAMAQAGSGMGNGAGIGTGMGGGEGSGAGLAIGATMGDFKLSDVSGKERTLASVRGAKGTVFVFVSVQCPVSNGYNERYEKLAQDYKAQGVNVVAVYSNVTESNDDVKNHVAEHKFTFTILRDKDNRLADMLGAEHTPEAYFLDAGNKLVYRGRIDNSRDASSVNSNDLREAIDATLAGKPVTKNYVRAFGCSIKRA